MEKKVYEAPEATLVEFDFTDRIAESGCMYDSYSPDPGYFMACRA